MILGKSVRTSVSKSVWNSVRNSVIKATNIEL